MNNISPAGIESLTARGCGGQRGRGASGGTAPAKRGLHGCKFNPELPGYRPRRRRYNNIPIPDCTEHVVVFNNPGANAEAVKELERARS